MRLINNTYGVTRADEMYTPTRKNPQQTSYPVSDDGDKVFLNEYSRTQKQARPVAYLLSKTAVKLGLKTEEEHKCEFNNIKFHEDIPAKEVFGIIATACVKESNVAYVRLVGTAGAHQAMIILKDGSIKTVDIEDEYRRWNHIGPSSPEEGSVQWTWENGG